MLRILVVDDEPRQRKILSQIIREFRKEYEVLEARNGEEALALCQRYRIDIVFGDIRMPRMDGLSMIEQMGKVNGQTRFVVVSGYSEFDYARKALEYHVYSYMLKPIESGAVCDMLVQLEDEIVKARISEHEKKTMTEQLNMLKPLYLERLMGKWIKGECSQGELDEAERTIGYRGRGCIVLSRLASNPKMKGGAKYSPDEMEEIRTNVKMWMSEMLNSQIHIVSFFLPADTDCMVSLLRCSAQAAEGSGHLAQKLQTMAVQLQQEYEMTLSIGMGQMQEDVFASVSEAYRTAEIALRCRFYRSHAAVIRFEEIQDVYVPILKNAFPFEDELKQFVYGSKQPIVDRMDDGLKAMLDRQYPDPLALLEEIGGLMLRLLHGIRAIAPEETMHRIEQKIKESLHPALCANVAQLKRYGVELLQEMANAVHLQKENKNSIVMERCLQYIRRHYAEELALDELAQRYYFNPSYFSTLFKKYTGKHFTGYVTDLRLEIAYNKLLETDKKVYEVAQEVGYKDIKYFFKLFKKRFGLTPDECRIFNQGRNATR